MPLSASSRPRNMFPPPTTAATWTPSLTTATISRAMRCTPVGERPGGPPPGKPSPASLPPPRRHGLCTRSVAAAGSAAVAVPPPSAAARPLLVVAAPSLTAEPVARAAPSPLSALLSTRRPPPLVLFPGKCPSACLADLEARERLNRGALLAEHLLDRLLGILDERLLDERDILEERAQPALGAFGPGRPRLALLPGDLLRVPALVPADVGRYLVAGHVLRAHRRDLLGAVLARLLVRRLQLNQHAHGRRQRAVGPVQVAGD